jgi:hypothetical protein
MRPVIFPVSSYHSDLRANCLNLRRPTAANLKKRGAWDEEKESKGAPSSVKPLKSIWNKPPAKEARHKAKCDSFQE